MSSVENVWNDGGGAPATRLCVRAPEQIPKSVTNHTDSTATHVLIFMTHPPCAQRLPGSFIWNFVPWEYTTPALRPESVRVLHEPYRMIPGNTNLPIGGLHDAIQENGVPGQNLSEPARMMSKRPQKWSRLFHSGSNV